MEKNDIPGVGYCISAIIAFVLAIFCAQYVANFFACTGMMWWIVAIIAYVVSGVILGGLAILILLVLIYIVSGPS